MNKLNIYNNLCSSRKSMNRFKGDGNYYERHHIIPKWMGGNDDDSNLVLLTAREHYIAHYLLFLHYRDKKSAAAFMIMNKSCNMNYRDSKKYSEVREFQSKIISGDLNPSKRLDVRKKISQKVSGKNNGMYGMVGELNPAFGMKHTKEFLDYKRKLHGKRLEFNGVIYDSIRQAEKESGVSRYKIKKSCKFL
jgi:hypothetical protein